MRDQLVRNKTEDASQDQGSSALGQLEELAEATERTRGRILREASGGTREIAPRVQD